MRSPWMHLDLEVVGPAGYPKQVRPLHPDHLRGLQTRRTKEAMSMSSPTHIFSLYLHDLKLSLDFVIVSIVLERLPQLFYLSCLIDMTSAVNPTSTHGLPCSKLLLRVLLPPCEH